MSTSRFLRFVRYLLLRGLGIFATIVAGVFTVVVILNQSSFIDQAVITEAGKQAQAYVNENPAQYATMSIPERNQVVAELTDIFAKEAGISLPYWQRQMRWTLNMLTFNWGDVKGVQITDKGKFITFVVAGGPTALRHRASAIVAQHFPNTLLLIGVAYAFIFSLGIPLALHLARHYNNWLDRLVTGLAPLSSIPSWTYGILLVSIFVIQLRWLPFGGKYDVIPPENTAEAIPMVARHMVLPVLAIIFSMFFQVVYAWRTYFMLYAEEDYVDMAVAKGLPERMLDIRYILRPTLPYILTSFAFTLTGFWQMTTALEYFFNWPGIGWMYIQALLRDDLLVALGVVVIFAYVLGAIVLLLDLLYLILDPRIRFNIASADATRLGRVVQQRRGATRRAPFRVRISLPRLSLRDSLKSLHEWYTWSARPVLVELRLYPAAFFSLTLIVILVAISIYALITYPYTQLDQLWNPELSQHRTRPALARPLWFNWFLSNDLPENISFDTRQTPELKQTIPGAETTLTTITYDFTVPDGGFPQDGYLYFHTKYRQKKPFLSITWITPDGREFKLKNVSVQNGAAYNLAANIPKRYLDERYKNLSLPVSGNGEYPLKALFANPASPDLIPLAGTYQIRLEIIAFEPDTQVDAEYFLLGQVYGWAGTDHLRRELSVGLLWGLPVALSIGMLGALTTSLFAMLIAAASAWLGGWVDALAQRITEFNMMLPILAVGVLLATYFHISIWAVLAIAILLNAFGGTTRTYRAAFLQVKEAPYMEAARAYGATDARIILRYMIPRIFPLMIPQVVMLIPGYVFLEATLAIFKVSTPYTPTWGRIIYDAVTNGAMLGYYYWLIEPIALLLITSLAFAMLGFTLDRILNPRLRTV